MKDFDINKIAGLSMLELKEEEKLALKQDMEEIVAFAEKIAEAGETGPEWELQQASLREDAEGLSLTPEEAFSAAPEKRDEFFFVPQVVE